MEPSPEIDPSEMLSIVKESTGPKILTVESYVLTSEPECGDIVFSFSVTSGYNPFTNGDATIANNVITFNNLSIYTDGQMTI